MKKPDILWMMTDPRFYEWLWAIENEIRPMCPIVYYHVWDNFPAPHFNKKFYESNDIVVAISKLTHDVVKEVSPEVPSRYIPHAVREDVFKPIPEEQRKSARTDLRRRQRQIYSLLEQQKRKTKTVWYIIVLVERVAR